MSEQPSKAEYDYAFAVLDEAAYKCGLVGDLALRQSIYQAKKLFMVSAKSVTESARSLLIDQLRALVETWRIKARTERATIMQGHAFQGMYRAIATGVAAMYDNHADQLDALIGPADEQKDEQP